MVRIESCLRKKILSVVVAVIVLLSNLSQTSAKSLLSPPSSVSHITATIIRDEDTASAVNDLDGQFREVYLKNMEMGELDALIETMLASINRMNVAKYEELLGPKLRNRDRNLNRMELIEELEERGDLIKIFPFLELLHEKPDKGGTAKKHTMDVFDAFDRLVRRDTNGYHTKRIETYEKNRSKEKKKEPVERIEIADKKIGLSDLLDMIFNNKIDPRVRELMFLLPIIHDVGKVIQKGAHPETGARYFVRPILEKLGFPEELVVLAQKLIRKHVDLSTVITAERTPAFMREGLEGNQTAMNMLTLLSIADRSYGDRACDLNTPTFKEYLAWGNLESAAWHSPAIDNWEKERLKKYSRYSDADAFIKDAITDDVITDEDFSVLKQYFGKNISVIDYGKAVFETFYENDHSDIALFRLFVILSKVAKIFDDDPDSGNRISRINLTNDGGKIKTLYTALQGHGKKSGIGAKLSGNELIEQMKERGVEFYVSGKSFLNLIIIDIDDDRTVRVKPEPNRDSTIVSSSL